MIRISEEKDLKERFGNLGLYLVEKAKEEIKEINRQNLFQKAEIRKRYIDRANESSLRTRGHFIETYNQYLNSMLSKTLIDSKEEVLKIKNQLVEKLKNIIKNYLKDNIEDSYSNYINFLIHKIKENKDFIDKPSKIIILFNSKDFNYFNENTNKLKNLFKNAIEIKKDPHQSIGGFKVILANGDISVDYSVDDIINKNLSIIQQEFSNIISDSEIKEIESNFENFIQNQKKGIEQYLVNYDRI